jgi:hypothetical protein
MQYSKVEYLYHVAHWESSGCIECKTINPKFVILVAVTSLNDTDNDTEVSLFLIRFVI